MSDDREEQNKKFEEWYGNKVYQGKFRFIEDMKPEFHREYYCRLAYFSRNDEIDDLRLKNADLEASRKGHMEAVQELQAENYKLMKSRDFSREASEELLAENKKLRADIALRVDADFWGEKDLKQANKDIVTVINQHAATLQELDKLRKLVKGSLYSDELRNGHGDYIGALNDYFEELDKEEKDDN